MPYSNPQKRKEYARSYRQVNREKLLAGQRRWYQENRERAYQYRREYYAKHKEHLEELHSRNRRRQYREWREAVINHYGGKCACCSETILEFLSIDHINGGGNKHRKEIGIPGGGAHFYKWLIKNNYPAGFRILCMNCNTAMGFFGYCPHQTLPVL